MREPNIKGPTGRAWRYDLAVLRGFNAPPDASVGLWLVDCPTAHPCWTHYAVSVIHLRPVPGMGPPLIYNKEATHEVTVFAVNPEQKVTLEKRPPVLHPPNYGGQIHARDDDHAVELVEQAVVDVCEGRLNPDSDAIAQWAQRFGSEMIKSFAPDVILDLGTQTIVKGTGAAAMRELERRAKEEGR